jgi:hypothetical protein
MRCSDRPSIKNVLSTTLHFSITLDGQLASKLTTAKKQWSLNLTQAYLDCYGLRNVWKKQVSKLITGLKPTLGLRLLRLLLFNNAASTTEIKYRRSDTGESDKCVVTAGSVTRERGRS